jgi:hypothetical protein
LPPFLEQFQQVSFFHLHTCVHSICTIFTLPRPTQDPPPPPPPIGTNTPRQDVLRCSRSPVIKSVAQFITSPR